MKRAPGPDRGFFRGLVVGVLMAIVLWALIILAIWAIVGGT